MSQLRFGWRLPMWPADETPAAQHLAEVEHHLRQLQGRYDSVWLSDHFVPGNSWKDPATPTWECLSTLAYFAGAFPYYDYGTIVLANSYRAPSLLAKMAATLQALTRGRFILGIGAGWKEDEYRAYGYEFPSAGVRIDQLAEGLTVLRAMWSGAPASWRGRYYHIDQAYCNPLPEPPPPVLIGGGGERRTLRVVARHADWWDPLTGSPSEFLRKREILWRYCAEIDRPPSAIQLSWEAAGLAIASTHEAALRLAQRSPFYAHYPDSALIGTAEQIAEQLHRYREIGVRQFILRFADFPDPTGALRFAEEVMPLLR